MDGERELLPLRDCFNNMLRAAPVTKIILFSKKYCWGNLYGVAASAPCFFLSQLGVLKRITEIRRT